MGARLAGAVAATALAVLILCGVAAAAPSQYGDGGYRLTATSTGSTYAPTFTGNGLLGVRVPPAGQG